MGQQVESFVENFHINKIYFKISLAVSLALSWKGKVFNPMENTNKTFLDVGYLNADWCSWYLLENCSIGIRENWK